jgi:hypothetical protein
MKKESDASPEMVGRVAQRLGSWLRPGLDARHVASAVITVMREPTEAMVAALLRDKFLDATEHNQDAITLDWQIMIDEALK